MTSAVCLRRLRRELLALKREPDETVRVATEADSLLVWHFVLSGVKISTSPDPPSFAVAAAAAARPPHPTLTAAIDTAMIAMPWSSIPRPPNTPRGRAAERNLCETLARCSFADSVISKPSPRR